MKEQQMQRREQKTKAPMTRNDQFLCQMIIGGQAVVKQSRWHVQVENLTRAVNVDY